MQLRSLLPNSKTSPTDRLNRSYEQARPVIGELARRLSDTTTEPARLADTDGLGDLDVAWGAVASNVVQNELSAASSLRIELPTERPVVVALARSGLFMAIARQRSLDWTRFGDDDASLLKAWSTSWRPSDVMQPLFRSDGSNLNSDPVDWADPSREVVAFLDADRVPRTDAVPDQSVVVFPWLRDMVRDHALLRSETVESILDETAQASQELMDNVRLHADMNSSDLCYVSYAITGQVNTPDLELHMTVLDTGVGIPAAARAQGTPLEAPDKIVMAALSGEIRKRDRGRGLNRIAHLAERRSGRFFLATGDDHGGAVIAACDRTSAPAVSLKDDLHLKGTVAVVTLPLVNS